MTGESISRRLACILTMATIVLAASPARAEIEGAQIAINTGTPEPIRSVSVTTMSIVTNPAVGKVSYIEIFFGTEPGRKCCGLRIVSRDQRRVEAFYSQILQATAAHQPFQITVYATGTFQANGYVENLDLGWTYFILH